MSHSHLQLAADARPTGGDFAYRPVEDAGGVPLAVSVYCDREQRLDEWVDDILLAGLVLREQGALGLLLSEDARPLGELVLVDCATLDSAGCAALARLDMRAAHASVQLVVSASAETLELVFACCDQSRAVILVDPSPAERLVALGQAMARGAASRVRELSEEERALILRLSEQVNRIAARLDGGNGAGGAGESVFRFGNGAANGSVANGHGKQTARAELPDPRIVRRIIRQRQMRARFFDGDLFADPAWDMLLDLTAARAERNRVSVTSLCIASGVPPTTALRWIGQMVEAGLFERIGDEADRRRAFIALTDRAAESMANYFAETARIPAPA